MPIATWKTCPYCGLQNISERRICKRCRGDISGSLTPPLIPATEETLTMYSDESGKRLFTFSPHWLEYAAPDIAFRTHWSNLTTIHRALWEYHLYMFKEPEILRAGLRHMSRNGETTFLARRVGLNGFGFPENKTLCADLRRYAPQLSKYIPK